MQLLFCFILLICCPLSVNGHRIANHINSIHLIIALIVFYVLFLWTTKLHFICSRHCVSRKNRMLLLPHTISQHTLLWSGEIASIRCSISSCRLTPLSYCPRKQLPIRRAVKNWTWEWSHSAWTRPSQPNCTVRCGAVTRHQVRRPADRPVSASRPTIIMADRVGRSNIAHRHRIAGSTVSIAILYLDCV